MLPRSAGRSVSRGVSLVVLVIASGCSDGGGGAGLLAPSRDLRDSESAVPLDTPTADAWHTNETLMLYGQQGYYQLNTGNNTLVVGSDTIWLTDQQSVAVGAELRGIARADSIVAYIDANTPTIPPCSEGGPCDEFRGWTEDFGTPASARSEDFRTPASARSSSWRSNRVLPNVEVRHFRTSPRARPTPRAGFNASGAFDGFSPFNGWANSGGGPTCSQLLNTINQLKQAVYDTRITFEGFLIWFALGTTVELVNGVPRLVVPSGYWTGVSTTFFFAQNQYNRVALDIATGLFRSLGCMGMAPPWVIVGHANGGGTWTSGSYVCTEEYTEIWVDGELYWSGYARWCDFVTE